MASATKGDHLANFADLQENMRALFAHVETAQLAVQAHLDRTTSSNSMASNSSSDVVEPLTATCINDIVRSASSKASTWADLQKQYPPNRSCLVPLCVAVSSDDASSDADLEKLDPRLEADAAYSQAATMAAYGIELLNLALDGAQVDRRRVRQTSDILAKLCATLIDSRNRHRGAGTSRLGERAGSCRPSKGSVEEPGSALESGRAVTIERDLQRTSPIVDEQGEWACVRVTNKRNRPYSRGRQPGQDASSETESESDLELVCAALTKHARQSNSPTASRRKRRDSKLGGDTSWNSEASEQPTPQLNSSDLETEVGSTTTFYIPAQESDIDDILDYGESIGDKPDSMSEESVGGSATSSVTN